MADAFDPDAYLNTSSASAFDPDAYLKAAPTPSTNPLSEGYNAAKNAVMAVGHYLNPFSAERHAAYERGDSGILETGKGLGAAISAPLAGPLAAAASTIAHPLSWADMALRAGAVKLHGEDKVAAAEKAAGITPGYEGSKEAAEQALSALRPARAPVRTLPGPGYTPAKFDISPTRPAYEWESPTAAVPPPPAPNGPLGVTLSEGQATGELPLIQREQAALRGASGDAAQQRAQAFADQQRGQVQQAQENVARGLDPYGGVVAETPQEAGQLVSQAVQSAAAQRKAAVTQAYDTAKSLPGEIHADAFKDVGQQIKTDLSGRPDPIVIDDKLTPYASRAIQDIEDRVGNLNIQNRADPLGQPNAQSIVGVSLKGVDQMRRRLSAFRSDAFASGNAADGRAAKAVLDAFDNHVDQAVNSGLFNGDPRAVQAWNDARAAHADYKRTFSAGKNDPTGRVVERILGKGNNPAAIPNDVADFMYGSTGTNPGSLNVNVAKRIRSILGDQSPEWAGVKQGLFQRLVDSGTGVADFGPAKIAQRINKFMNVDGVELAKEMFSPQERQLIQQYADLQRKIQVPQAGANWSNTSTVLAPMMKKISSGISGLIGAAVGHIVAPGAFGIGEFVGSQATSKVAGAVSNAREMRRISAQMPLVAQQMQKWQRAVAAANRTNAPMSQAAVNLASANLAQSLQRLGLNPRALIQGTVPAGADQQQQQ